MALQLLSSYHKTLPFLLHSTGQLQEISLACHCPRVELFPLDARIPEKLMFELYVNLVRVLAESPDLRRGKT
jgi:hypothetical protein